MMYEDTAAAVVCIPDKKATRNIVTGSSDRNALSLLHLEGFQEETCSLKVSNFCNDIIQKSFSFPQVQNPFS